MKTEQKLLALAKKEGWNWISRDQKLLEEFIEKYSNEVDWYYISRDQKLSEEFIEKYSDKVDWSCISKYQKLSEELIEKHSDKVNWCGISAYQKLSEEFIEEHSDKVDWYWISIYQKLSEKLIEKYNLRIPKDNWLYTTKREKLKFIQKHTDYEVIDGQYIIAYKTVRDDYYSVFNFQYKYEIGKTYESHCNCNLDEDNSFGLSAWTKEGALGYYNEGRLLKVKINIKDIGAIVKNYNKIRCFKLEVIEEVER